MRRLAVLALVLAAACGGDASTGATDSGIAGTTVSGPTCPVEIAGSPCPDRPISAKLFITKRGSDDVVASVTSNERGEFRVALAPGAYTIHPLGTAGPPTGGPQDVTVRAHSFTRVTFQFDSGIR
jgi:hypothetical protein